ncbi:hypothetical protein [Nocardioides jejuensis]|uniref:Uncharacterized protein n=1 Tax=Nocardioides jejuensis TaxID=2502782 RepID=A0A4V2NXM6_9ACTN|nr:hypothetical protein [Nocardioides jejuensis]TCJ21822.1 hypothetical protein EPD65_14215 [Nocardioides jejuensis]
MVFQVPRQRVAALVDSWATAAQQQACRNAMVASTALARTRAQRIVVEEFLAARLGSRAEVSGSATGALPPRAPEADPLPPTLSQVAD